MYKLKIDRLSNNDDINKIAIWDGHNWIASDILKEHFNNSNIHNIQCQNCVDFKKKLLEIETKFKILEKRFYEIESIFE